MEALIHMPDETGPDPNDGTDYQRLYEYRHRHVQQGSREAVWSEISPFVYELMGRPVRVLDPAAGRGEFISAIPAAERWMVDAVEYPEAHVDSGVKKLFGDIRQIELPRSYFDGIFISNLLEHFTTQEEIGRFLRRMLRSTEPGGRVAVLGPNFRYCAKQYFDFADHTLALTHLAIAEHLYATGFEVVRVIPRFLPYSFSGTLPPSRALTRAYLRLPLAWRLLGKQFLVIGRAPG
jgi:SAM-dependent methyltransferase